MPCERLPELQTVCRQSELVPHLTHRSLRARMKIISVESVVGANDWDAFIQTVDGATSAHQFGWKQIIADSFDHECHYLVAIDDCGQWQGVLPLVHMRSMLFGNSLVSVPFANYGGIVCTGELPKQMLLAEAERLRISTGALNVELRNLSNVVDSLPTRQHKVSMVLELAPDLEMQWKRFDPKLRNQIRKAEKSGLRWVVGQSELLEGFYDVFARNMRDLGTPVHSKEFFRNFLSVFSENSRILAIYHDDRVIAAGIGTWFRDTFEVPWASSISEFKRFCPNNLLYWTAIRTAIEGGHALLDFGRSTPNEGTYNFKKQWGALPRQLNWQYLVGENALPGDGDAASIWMVAASRIWRRLPVSLTRLVGPMIRKHISL